MTQKRSIKQKKRGTYNAGLVPMGRKTLSKGLVPALRKPLNAGLFPITRKTLSKGFTLMELIVVMAILTILVLIAAPKFIEHTSEAKKVALLVDIKNLGDKLIMETIENPNLTEKWTLVDPDRDFVGGKLYNLKGEEVEGPLILVLKKYPEDLQRKAGLKNPGSYFVDKEGNVYGLSNAKIASGGPGGPGKPDSRPPGEIIGGVNDKLPDIGDKADGITTESTEEEIKDLEKEIGEAQKELDKAKEAIDAMDPGEKDAAQEKLDKAQEELDAIKNQVDKIIIDKGLTDIENLVTEGTVTDNIGKIEEIIKDIQDKINGLDSPEKEEEQGKLDAIKNQVDKIIIDKGLEDLTTEVGNGDLISSDNIAEIETAITDLQAKIEAMPEGDDKTAAQGKLDAIKDKVQAAKDKIADDILIGEIGTALDKIGGDITDLDDDPTEEAIKVVQDEIDRVQAEIDKIKDETKQQIEQDNLDNIQANLDAVDPNAIYLAKDSDFSGTTNGTFRYTGTETKLEIPHTIKGIPVTSYKEMFQGTKVELVKSTNTNVTDMNNMFHVSKAPTLDLSSFVTSNVTTMNGMFGYSAATSIDLSSFNTTSVTNMYTMFLNSEATNLDLSSFDTTSVTNMNDMFNGSPATTGYARTQTDADRFNGSRNKPAGLNFIVK